MWWVKGGYRHKESWVLFTQGRFNSIFRSKSRRAEKFKAILKWTVISKSICWALFTDLYITVCYLWGLMYDWHQCGLCGQPITASHWYSQNTYFCCHKNSSQKGEISTLGSPGNQILMLPTCTQNSTTVLITLFHLTQQLFLSLSLILVPGGSCHSNIQIAF